MKTFSYAQMERLKEILFERAVGRPNAITIGKLAREIGANDERQIQLYAEKLREQKIPVLSAVTKPFGLYIPANPEEARPFYQQMQSRIDGVAHTKKLIKDGIRRMFNLPEEKNPNQLQLGISMDGGGAGA